jgi:hypothetical protein
MRFRRPIAIMTTESLPVTVAHERGAIYYFWGALAFRRKILHFGEEGEPAAEYAAVLFTIETQEIGRAIGGSVRHSGHFAGDSRGRSAGGYIC